ncbi:MAG: S1 family peptidase [Roseinatronobacter sp.]|jgi:protease YdgD|nr:S1 family peptidase [Roseinatronobacter sp.]
MIRTLISALLAVIGIASAPMAQDKPLEMLETGLQVQGWEAVGRIDIGASGYCTGALISEKLVLTAAHCLFARNSGARLPDDQLLFRAGFRNGRAAAEAQVLRSVVHPRYLPLGGVTLENVSYDLALLELTFPIRSMGVTPFAVYSEPRTGDQVGVVSYGRGRLQAPALQERCRVLERDPLGVLMMSCTVDFGSSGAPVFAMSQGRPHIVSVVSAKARSAVGGQLEDVSLGVALGPKLDTLRAALDARDRRFIQPPAIGANVPREMSAGGGARFLRP